MMLIRKQDASGLMRWSLFDENCLVRHYSGQLSRQSVIEAIWGDFGDGLAITIGHSE